MPSAPKFARRFKRLSLCFIWILATTIPETKNVLHGVIDSQLAPFAVTPQNICGHGGIRCPLHAGDTVVYEVTLQCPDYVAPVGKHVTAPSP